MRRYISMLSLWMAVAATGVVAGCAGNQLRTDRPTSGIRAAEVLGAEKVPQAALHLALAKEGVERAKKFAEAGDEERATSMLWRAEADAELAAALSSADTEKTEANEAIERVKQLRDENKGVFDRSYP